MSNARVTSKTKLVWARMPLELVDAIDERPERTFTDRIVAVIRRGLNSPPNRRKQPVEAHLTKHGTPTP